MRIIGLFIQMLLVALAAGCTVGPNYRPEHIQTPDEFAERAGSSAQAPLSRVVPEERDISEWWRQLGDPKLDQLIAQALSTNFDLLGAASRIRAARDAEYAAGARLLPSFSATGLAAHLHANSNPLSALNGGASGSQGGAAGGSGPGSPAATGATGLDLSAYSLGFDATWELDVFGGTRRALEAAGAATLASVWQLRDAQVSVSAEVANDYIALRATQARINIDADSVRSQSELLKVASARARTGFVTQLDVNQQESQLAATRAQIPTLQGEERALLHALAVLIGQPPEALSVSLKPDTPVPHIPATLPAGLPSDLLRRRPDVRVAERNLARASAEVGVAVAALYPRFDLIGGASYFGQALHGLVSSRNFSNVGAGLIDWPFFDWGRLRANVRGARETRMQAYFAYRTAVLRALQDAEDAIARYVAEQGRYQALVDSEAAARSSLSIATAQYRAGVVSFINVLQASADELAARDQLEQSEQALAQGVVALYKALGGGWSERSQAGE